MRLQRQHHGLARRKGGQVPEAQTAQLLRRRAKALGHAGGVVRIRPQRHHLAAQLAVTREDIAPRHAVAKAVPARGIEFQRAAVLDQMAAWNKADPGCFLPSVMSQYTPFYQAADHGIGRRITTYEYRRVVNYAMDLGLSSGYMQQKSSAKEEYTPSFDLTGV